MRLRENSFQAKERWASPSHSPQFLGLVTSSYDPKVTSMTREAMRKVHWEGGINRILVASRELLRPPWCHSLSLHGSLRSPGAGAEDTATWGPLTAKHLTQQHPLDLVN